MYRQFNIQQFYVLPTQSIYLFFVDLGINWLVFKTELMCVYCAVRAGSLMYVGIS